MYTTYNKDHVYFVYDRKTGLRTRIGKKDALIQMLTEAMRTTLPYYERRQIWTEESFRSAFYTNIFYSSRYEKRSNVFTEQNLTGKDRDRQIAYQRVLIEWRDGVPFWHYFTDVTKPEKRYTFYTGSGAVVNVYDFMDEVKQQLMLPSYSLPKHTYHWQYQKTTPHTRARYHLNHCHRTNAKLLEDTEVKCRVKSLPPDPWEREHFTRKSTGWKDHKYKKQWMHNIENKKTSCNSARKYWMLEEERRNEDEKKWEESIYDYGFGNDAYAV